MSREKTEGWIVESMRFHGPKLGSCELVDGDQRMSLIGEYLPPSTLDHLPDLEDLLNRFQGREPVVLGDLNASIGRLRNPQYQQVAYFLASFGMVDLLAHFQQRSNTATYRNGGMSGRGKSSDPVVTMLWDWTDGCLKR